VARCAPNLKPADKRCVRPVYSRDVCEMYFDTLLGTAALAGTANCVQPIFALTVIRSRWRSLASSRPASAARAGAQ
jgi:hypothetical protein